LVWSSGQIKEAVATGARFLVDLIETLRQSFISALVFELASMIKDRFGKRFPNVIADCLARKLATRVFELVSELVVAFLSPGETDDCHGRREIAIGGKVVERGNQFAMSKIAGSTEDHDGARLWHCADGDAFAQRIQGRLICASIHVREKRLLPGQRKSSG